MPRTHAAIVLLSLAAPSLAGTFVVEHDVLPRVEAGRIVVGGVPHGAGGAEVPEVDVFGFLFGEDGAAPNAAADPGFDVEPDAGFPAGQPLRFDGARHLAYWDGTGAPSFARADGEYLRLTFGAATADLTSQQDVTPGFTIGNVSATTGLHRHLNAALLTTDPTVPPDGLYVAALRLGAPGVARSAAFLVAYSFNLDESTAEPGLAYLATPRAGDADYSGAVGFADLALVALNYNALADASWFDGDFTGDGAVGFDDLAALAVNYGTAAPAPAPSFGAAFDADWARARASVPEPTVALLAPVAALALVRRRG